MFVAGRNSPAGFFMAKLKVFRNPSSGEVYNDISKELQAELDKVSLPDKGARFKLLPEFFNPVKMGQAETDSPSRDEVVIDRRFLRVGEKTWRATATIYDPYKGEYVQVTAALNIKKTGRNQIPDAPQIKFQAKSGVMYLTKNPDNERIWTFLMLVGWVANSPLYTGDKPVMTRTLTEQKAKCEYIDTEFEVKKNVEDGQTLKAALDLIYNKDIELDVHYAVAMELGYTDSKSEAYIQGFLLSMAQGETRGQLIAAYNRDDKKSLFAMIVDAIEFGILRENAAQKTISFTDGKRALANLDPNISPKSIGRYRALIEHLVSDEGSSDRAKLEREMERFTEGSNAPAKPKGGAKKAASAPAESTAPAAPEAPVAPLAEDAEDF